MDTQHLQDLVAQLRLLGTDQQSLEVKSGVGKDIRHTLSAFSNASGGMILVGLNEKAGFEPVSGFDAPAARDQVVSRCAQLSPVVRPEIEIVPFGDGAVLVVHVPEMQPRFKPCYVTEQGRYNGSYLRSGDADVRMSSYEVDRLLEEHYQPLWDEEGVVEASVEDLGADFLDGYLESQRKLRPRTFAQGVDVAMERLRITKSGNPTLAALLAMGEYPQEFFPRLTVSFAVFPGTDRGDITAGVRLLDSQTFAGSIPELVEAAVGAVNRNMRTAASIDGIYRTEVPDYPLVAVREAVVNALMHRDYSPEARGAQVQVNMFVDRLEVMNPGGLYGAVTVETLGQTGVSASRNQRLSTLLEAMPAPGGGALAENRGTGIAVIQRALSEALMPPLEIRNSPSSFTVVFHRRRAVQSTKSPDLRDRVIALLDGWESASTVELVHTLGVSRSAVQKALNHLLNEGLVEAAEPPRSPKQRYRRVR